MFCVLTALARAQGHAASFYHPPNESDPGAVPAYQGNRCDLNDGPQAGESPTITPPPPIITTTNSADQTVISQSDEKIAFCHYRISFRRQRVDRYSKMQSVAQCFGIKARDIGPRGNPSGSRWASRFLSPLRRHWQQHLDARSFFRALHASTSAANIGWLFIFAASKAGRGSAP